MAQKKFSRKILSKIEKLDRKEIEAYLQKAFQEKDLLSIIFDSLTRAILVTNIYDEIIYHNKHTFLTLGIKPKNIISEIRFLFCRFDTP